MQKYIIVFLMFCRLALPAQNLQSIVIDPSYGSISFATMTEKLQLEYGIEIITNKSWTDNISTPQIRNRILLADFLRILFADSELHAVIYQGYIVILPGGLMRNNEESNKTNSIIIGNPLNKGRYANAKVSGRVFDGASKSPIPGAQVIFNDLSLAISTNSEGFFSTELPTGNINVRFAFMGLEDEVRDLVIYNDGEFEVDLYEKTISLNEINITSNRPEENFRSTSMGMVRMDMKTMQKLSVLMGEPDIIKSMVLLPGIQSTGENASGFNVRGGNIDQNLILIQDAPIFNTSHLFGLFSMFDQTVVKDVTLYKSGLPARYGGRIASVMSIDLNQGNSEKIKVNGGIGIVNSRISAEGPLTDKITFMAGVRSTYSDWMLKIMKNYELKNSSANFYDFNAKLDYSINQRNRISIFGYGSRDNFDYFQNAGYEYGNMIGTARWSHIFNNNNSGTLSVNSSYYDASIDDFSEQNVEFNLKTSILQQQLAYHFSSDIIPRHKFNTGFNVIRYHLEPGKAIPYSDMSIFMPVTMESEKAFELGAYFEDEFDITHKLAVIAGLRYSAFLLNGPGFVNEYMPQMPRNELTYTGTQEISANEIQSFHSGMEPRIALRYELNNTSSIKAGYNRTTQYIRQISNTASITPADYWKASDNYLDPLLSDQYSIGYFKNFRNNMFETSFEIYYKDIQNDVDYKNGASLILNPKLEQALIAGIGNAYGAELLLKKSRGDLSGWLAYTYSRSFKKIDGLHPEEKINKGNWYKSNYDKPHDFTLVMNYKISRRYTVSGNFTYSTGRPATYPERKYKIGNHEIVSYSDRNKYRLPDYHRLDLAFTYEGSLLKEQKWRSSWTFSLYNVYGRKNTFSVFYEKQKPSHLNNYREYALFKFAVIGVPIPSFTYNFWF